MPGTEEINKLKQQIQELSTEIKALKQSVAQHLSLADYRTIHAKFVSFTNLHAIAKNELEALLFRYKIVLSGKSAGPSEKPGEKVFRGKLKSEINCRLFVSKNLDVSISSHKEMYDYITKHYSELFRDGKFKIKSVIQLK